MVLLEYAPSVLHLEHSRSLDISRARALLVLIKHAPSVQLLEHPCSLDISGARALVIITEHAPPGIYEARTRLIILDHAASSCL